MPEPDIIHAWEQMGAFSGDLAKQVWAYFEVLHKAGFTRAEALPLARDYQAHILSMTKRSP